MAYQKQEWRNNDRSTPLSAERLDHMEQGIADAHSSGGEGLSLVEDPPGSGIYKIGAQ